MPSRSESRTPIGRTALLTTVALLAFAGNSILCRLALRDQAIDAWSFTAIRLASGALLLLPVLGRRKTTTWRPRAAFALFAYALAFSLAYVSLDAGTGALLLFGTVQITMIGAGLRAGERPTALATAGVGAAIAGVVWLVLPGVRAPDPVGAMLMVAAGVAWGIYSLIGRGTLQPTVATARNFVMAAPIGIAALACATSSLSITPAGVWLAVASGAITSAIGYVLWYMALPGHSATSAAAVQLSVPLLAALGGVGLLDEEPSPRLLAASVLTIGGVATAIVSRR